MASAGCNFSFFPFRQHKIDLETVLSLTDEEALFSDWAIVGNDLTAATQQFDRENAVEIAQAQKKTQPTRAVTPRQK